MSVRFLSDKRKEIVTGFTGLIPVQEVTGEKIFNLIDERIKRCGQCLANCLVLQQMVHQTWLVATTLCGLDQKLYLLSVCISNVSVISWPCVFTMQYES